jgi:hypothetical protein
MPLIVVVLALLFVPWQGCQPGAAPPVQATGLHVLVMLENDSRDAMPPEKLAIIKSTAPGSVVASIKAAAAKGPDGEPMFRILDPNDPVDRDLPVFKQIMSHVQTSKKGSDWIAAVNGRKFYEGPLEPNAAAQLQRLNTVLK